MGKFFDEKAVLRWYRAGTLCLMKHWNSIDHHRHNKYLYLIRACLKDVLEYIKEKEKKELYSEFSNMMKYFMDPSDISADGAILHLIEIYFEEINHVFEGMTESQLTPLLEPILCVC